MNPDALNLAREPRLYAEMASWWSLLSPPEEYAEEASFYYRTLLEACDRPPQTILELGSGGGNNASFLKTHATMTLVDRSPGMLEVSRRLNPECEHQVGDMRTVRLERTFDAVFIHDAICYMTSEAEVRQALETAFLHTRPGGAALFAPDYVRENFAPLTDHGGSDGRDRSMRYMEWVWDPDPSDTTYVVDYAYLLRTGDGMPRVEHDRHVEGLFPRADWLRWITEAGFEARRVPFVHSEVDACQLEVFVGTRPAGQ